MLTAAGKERNVSPGEVPVLDSARKQVDSDDPEHDLCADARPRNERVCTKVQETLTTLAQDFLVYLEAERGYSPLTITAYQSDLSQLFEFMQHNGADLEPSELTTNLIRKWVVQMKHDDLSGATIRRHVYALKSFWTFLLDFDYVTHDPTRRVSTPKRKRRLPSYLNEDELRQLMDAAGQHRVDYCRRRNRAIIATFAFTGVRRGELLGLRVTEVDLIDRTVRIEDGKGGKTRILPLLDQACEAVQEWLEVRRDNDHDYLFTTTHGNRIHASRLQIIWKGILERSGIAKPGVTMHTLRHTFATLLLRSGRCDLVSLQKLLGHSRLDTTAIYLHVGPQQLREAVDGHPLADMAEEGI